MHIFFEAMKTQKINLQKHAKTLFFFQVAHLFNVHLHGFLWISWWLMFGFVTRGPLTAESYDLRSSRELRGFLLDFAVRHLQNGFTRWQKWGSFKMIFIKNWYYMDAFNTCFVDSAFFLHEAWGDENHSQYTLIKHFSSFELKSSWTWTLHVCIGCLVLYSKCLFLYCSALEEARSTPKFWWL